MRVLVTGCAGLIGSWVAEYLLKEEDIELIIGIDDLSGGEIENVTAIQDNDYKKRYRFFQFDIGNQRRLDEIFRAHRPDVVVHAAACAREGASAFQPVKIAYSNNYISTILFETAIKYKTKKIVFFSSMAVMGDQEVPFTENQPKMPVDIYGISKSTTETTLECLAKVHDFEYVIIRPHNCFAERVSLTDPYRNVIAIFTNRLMRKEPLYIFGDGAIRAFSYLADSTPAFIQAIMGKIKDEIIFVGGKEPTTIEELLEVVIESFKPDYKPEIIHLPSRPLEVHEAWCSIEKSVKLLNYDEKTGWREGVRRTINWAKKKGPQQWRVDDLPLINEKTPKPWLELGGK